MHVRIQTHTCIPHIYTYTQNQAQCLLNLSGDAVLLQPEHGGAQESDNPNGSQQGQPLSSMTLLPIPDPVASSQSDPSSTAATSQVKLIYTAREE